MCMYKAAAGFPRLLYAFRPAMKENDVKVTYSAGIQSRRARDSDIAITVGHHCHDIGTSALSLE